MYQPREEHDLLILLNQGIPPAWAVRHLGPKGYAFVNNYHLTASWLHAPNNTFLLLGVIDYDPDTNSTKLTLNKDGSLSRTLPLEAIAESREMEHFAFTTVPWIQGSGALPFERDAQNYIFQRRE